MTRPQNIQQSIKKALIIGSGPLNIGQTGAFDDATCRACHLFRQAGIETILVHCDPSALATDLDVADRTYMVPLTRAALTEVLLREKPDAVLATVGGPTALRLANACRKSGLFADNEIRLLGSGEELLDIVDAPVRLFAAADKLDIATPGGLAAETLEKAASAAEQTGYPVFVRAADPDGTLRQGIAYNVEELRHLASGGRLPAETCASVRIEQALSGHREVELVLLRDAGGRMQMVTLAENMDPVGIHSGDSVTVIPAQTIDSAARDQIEAAAGRMAEHLAVCGLLHLKFAVGSADEPVRLLAVDPGTARISGMIAKAYDMDLAAIHVRLSLGDQLETALGESKAAVQALRDPAVVAVRLPRWEFERFVGENQRLDATMKSTGAALGLGCSLTEALHHALRSRSPRHPVLGQHPDLQELDLEAIMRRLVVPCPQRLRLLVEAFKKGARPEALAAVTGIHRTWLEELAKMAQMETDLAAHVGKTLSDELLAEAMAAGLNAAGLAQLLACSEAEMAAAMDQAGVQTQPLMCRADEASRVLYHSAGPKTAAPSPLGKSVVIAGRGTSRIGHSIELDHCAVHASRALRRTGRQAIWVSANPDAAGSLEDADRTHAVPLTSEDIKAVCRFEEPEGVILQFGGYAAMDLAADLAAAGHSVLGTAPEQVALSQDRLRFAKLLTGLGIPHPTIGLAETPEAAMDLGESIGFPLVTSVPASRKRNRYAVVMDANMLEQDVMRTPVTPDSPMLVEQFLEFAIEVEADALCDGQSVYVPAIMEHIELAGVHSGDSAMVTPPYSTPPRHIETIGAYIRKVARKLNVRGLLNTRFAVYNDTVYMLAARPWACRSLPLISKLCDIPMAQRATEIMLGASLEEMDLPRRILPHYGIRSSVFPFERFNRADPLIGPQMRSTGQAMTLDEVFGMAYYSSQQAAGATLPCQGKLLITVTDDDKPSILEPARLFTEMGFGILATRGTHAFFKKHGIDSQLVKKLGFGRPDLVDAIKTGDVALVINTPSGRLSQQDDAHIRKTAIRYKVPQVTTPAAALAAAKGIAARKQGQDALCTLQSYARALK